jgi:hypothetical protein
MIKAFQLACFELRVLSQFSYRKWNIGGGSGVLLLSIVSSSILFLSMSFYGCCILIVEE